MRWQVLHLKRAHYFLQKLVAVLSWEHPLIFHRNKLWATPLTDAATSSRSAHCSTNPLPVALRLAEIVLLKSLPTFCTSNQSHPQGSTAWSRESSTLLL